MNALARSILNSEVMPHGTPHRDPPELRQSPCAARTPGNAMFSGVRVWFVGARATAGSILRSVAACTSRHSRIRRTSAGPAPLSSTSSGVIESVHGRPPLVLAPRLYDPMHARHTGGRRRLSIRHGPGRHARNSILKGLGRRSMPPSPRNPFVGDLCRVPEPGEPL